MCCGSVVDQHLDPEPAGRKPASVSVERRRGGDRGHAPKERLQADRGSRMSLFLLLELQFSIYDTQRQETKKLQKPLNTDSRPTGDWNKRR